MDPFRRSARRATVLRDQRVRRAGIGAIAAFVVGGLLLNLPSNAVPVKAGDGAAIARVTKWVRDAAYVAYVDAVHQSRRGAALAGERQGLTDADFTMRRNEIRAQIAGDMETLGRAKVILETLGAMRDEWVDLYGANSASPILGPSSLTAEELVAYVRSTAGLRNVKTTVPLIDVAQMFLDEGEIEGVRGDVAFAQAIKESASFSTPDIKINNFAGLGHCSACPRGNIFPTARDGARAQIQLLRWLADPSVQSLSDFESQPATLPKHFTGNGHSRATWSSLGGLWAPNPQYGDSVYQLYSRMQAFALARR